MVVRLVLVLVLVLVLLLLLLHLMLNLMLWPPLLHGLLLRLLLLLRGWCLPLLRTVSWLVLRCLPLRYIRKQKTTRCISSSRRVWPEEQGSQATRNLFSSAQ